MRAEEFERVRVWNAEHPERHYGSLSPRAKRDVERGKKRPLVLVLLGWFAFSTWRIVCLLVGIAFVLFVFWLLSKTGPGCQASPDLCVY